MECILKPVSRQKNKICLYMYSSNVKWALSVHLTTAGYILTFLLLDNFNLLTNHQLPLQSFFITIPYIHHSVLLSTGNRHTLLSIHHIYYNIHSVISILTLVYCSCCRKTNFYSFHNLFSAMSTRYLSHVKLITWLICFIVMVMLVQFDSQEAATVCL